MDINPPALSVDRNRNSLLRNRVLKEGQYTIFTKEKPGRHYVKQEIMFNITKINYTDSMHLEGQKKMLNFCVIPLLWSLPNHHHPLPKKSGKLKLRYSSNYLPTLFKRIFMKNMKIFGSLFPDLADKEAPSWESTSTTTRTESCSAMSPRGRTST